MKLNEAIELLEKYNTSKNNFDVVINVDNKKFLYVQRIVKSADFDGKMQIEICVNDINEAETLQKIRRGDVTPVKSTKKAKTWKDVCEETVGAIGDFKNIDKIGRKKWVK